MSGIRSLAAIAVAVPAIALAQVGPNPTVNGSLDPGAHSPNDPTSPEGGTPGNGMSVNETAPEDTVGNVTDNRSSEPGDTQRTTAPTSESKRKKPH